MDILILFSSERQCGNMKKQDIMFIIIVIVLVAFIIGPIVLNKEKVIIRDKIIVKIDPTRPVIALTFDDGPNYEYTIPILNILYEHKAVATFFVVGKNIKYNKHVLKKIEREGHEIANHTFDHYDLTTLNVKQIEEQIKMTEEKVKEVISGYSLNYVRPPYGRYTEEVIQTIDYPIALWSLDSKDWILNDSEKIANYVISKIKDGDVIVMHDTTAHSVKATKLIMSELTKREYQFVTLKELYEHRNDILESHQIYR